MSVILVLSEMTLMTFKSISVIFSCLIVCLFIYLFIYLFICLFIYLSAISSLNLMGRIFII